MFALISLGAFWIASLLIPPDVQRAMSKRAGSQTVEMMGSHAVYVSQPEAVADLIAKAENSDDAEKVPGTA